MITALVAEDDVVARHGLIALLRDAGIAVDTGGRSDVAVVGVHAPVGPDVDVVRTVSAAMPVVVVSELADEATVAAVIQAGASGYLVTRRFAAAEFVAAVRSTAAGDVVLSPTVARLVLAAVRHRRQRHDGELTRREAELLALICEGRSNAAIAGALYISEKTVKNHIGRIYAKLGVRTRAEAIAQSLAVTSGARRPALTLVS